MPLLARRLAVLTLVLAGLAVALPASAQFGKLKEKVKKKTEEKVDKKVDETLDGKGSGDAKSAEGNSEAPAGGDKPAAAPAARGHPATAEDMTLYTKYDFVPGDRVLFYDDLVRDEVGEFPGRWGLTNGVFEVARVGGHNWILCTDRGTIYPKMPVGPLPDRYTLELDIMSNADHEGWYYINWLDAQDDKLGTLAIGYGNMTYLDLQDKRLASKNIEKLAPGRHTLRVMATESTLKCYVDQERVANVPKVEGFAPVRFSVEVNPYFEDNKAALTGTLRYAEGGKTLREQLDEAGRIVTHGILFDSGSDRIKAESYKTLADIAGLLTDSPDLRLSIEGHTDADGADAANLTLSQKRAEAVKAWLVSGYKLDAARLETKGFGESKPIDKNDTAGGKANNRRVELVKL